ncbi:hypothetical protein [Pseudomonas fulva]|uniref:hypothetical protein n=1 Tax=Pseudomonas fulva TaxID=47880 RepID=UPI0005A0EC85|nr:hypothetical protein [Pseudomonas fulva]
MKLWSMPDSMKLFSVWAVWAFIAIGALGWGLFVVLEYFDSKNDAAVWVQAIGSVVAIGIAIWVPYHQGHQIRMQRLHDERQMQLQGYYSVLALIDQQLDLLSRIESANLGWSRLISDFSLAQLHSDLMNNQRQSDQLQVNAFGVGVIHYTLLIKDVGSFCGFYASVIDTSPKTGSSGGLRLLGFQATDKHNLLARASAEVEQMVRDC